MKRLFVLLVSLILTGAAAYAAGVPKLQGYVNDYGNMMSAGTKARITEQLKALEQSDSTQIFVLTVPSLEGRLTDLAAGRIIDNVMKPKFREGDYNGGFLAGVSSLGQATRGEFKADGGAGRKSPNYMPMIVILGICAVAAFVLGRRRPLYGIAAGVIGGPVSAISAGMPAPAILFFAAVFGGLAATFIAAIAWGLSGKGKRGTTSGGESTDRDFDSSFDSGWSSGSSDSDISGGGGEAGGGGASGDY